jgi:hypothetical protein
MVGSHGNLIAIFIIPNGSLGNGRETGGIIQRSFADRNNSINFSVPNLAQGSNIWHKAARFRSSDEQGKMCLQFFDGEGTGTTSSGSLIIRLCKKYQRPSEVRDSGGRRDGIRFHRLFGWWYNRSILRDAVQGATELPIAAAP